MRSGPPMIWNSSCLSTRRRRSRLRCQADGDPRRARLPAGRYRRWLPFACRNGRQPGWISIPTMRNLWCGPCGEPWTVLICGKHWPQVRSPSTVWRPSPGSPNPLGSWSTWMWPGSVGKQPTGFGSAPKTNTGPLPTSSWSCNLHWTNHGGKAGSEWTGPPGLSSTRHSPRKPMICPFSPTGPAATPHGAKQWPWPNYVSATIHHQPSSPYSSTPPTPPHRTGRQVSCWKPDPGSDETPSKPSSAMQSPKSPPDPKTAHPMVYGRRTRTIPPALRRAILHRDGNTCTGDGCPSTHRLQIHHIIPWSEGGTTDPENLITLCWYHHQIVVHQRGFQPYRHPEHGRIRFRKPALRGPPSG